MGAPSDALGQPGELKLSALMPKAAVSALIGRGGSAIKQLREASGAKIQIGDSVSHKPEAEQMLTITGSSRSLEYAMAGVIHQLQELNREPWFMDWASGPVPEFGPGPGSSGK